MGEQVKALITIVDRGKSGSVSALFNKKYPQVGFVANGVGTAGSELMDLLGLDIPEKDVILSLVGAAELPALMAELSGRRLLKSAGRGIAFSLRLSGISSLAQAALTQNAQTEEARYMTNEDRFSLVLAITEPGYSDAVMELAKGAGARGGTVIYARGVGHSGADKFLGISIQSEREIVAILTPAETRLEIMNAINTEFGLRAEAKGLVFSLPVEDMVQVS